jgi:4-amino-4-deoxy-L-arabinose transferase-like glycosyltransferase
MRAQAPPVFWRPMISTSFARPALLGTLPRRLSLRTQLALLLLSHLLVWTWVGVASRSNFDGPGDMVEAYVWAQGWQWGYYKHPPLSAWVTGLWFAVVPESQLGFSLLAAFNVVVGLAGLAVLARQFLPGRWVLLTVAAASLAPGVTGLAMRFNANAVLIATWPWVMAFFVRLMTRGRSRDAWLCGAVAALAVLGKYYSGVLLLSLLVTALWLPAWRRRLWSAPMALAVLVFGLCLAPHLSWLLAQTEGPLQYAQAAAGQQPATESMLRAITFALSQVVFPLLAFLALRLSLEGPARHRAFAQAVTAPLRPRGQAIWLMAMLPIITTMLATVATGARTASVWGLALAAGLALLAASRAHEAGANVNVKTLWRTMAVIWCAVALLAPLWWLTRAQADAPGAAEPREELAQALHSAWQAEVGGPLPYVSGTRALAASTAFYAPDHPQYWSVWNHHIETPWADAGDIAARGAMIVCELADLPCQQLAQSWSADRRSLRVAKVARGFSFAPHDYVYYLVRPLSRPSSLALARTQRP